jgi:hypothetical protein
MFRIAQATEQHSAEIQQLRLEAFRAAPEFQLSDERSLAWGSDDAEGIVLAAWHEGTIVSTTRANILRNSAAAERFMECDLSDIPLRYPALVLGKGATSPVFGRHGLHSILRYIFIRAARDCAIASVAGVVFEGAPRTRLMRRLGYEYFVPKRQWCSVCVPNGRILIAVLPGESFFMALNTLAGEINMTYVPESLCKEIALRVGAGHEQPELASATKFASCCI